MIFTVPREGDRFRVLDDPAVGLSGNQYQILRRLRVCGVGRFVVRKLLVGTDKETTWSFNSRPFGLQQYTETVANPPKLSVGEWESRLVRVLDQHWDWSLVELLDGSRRIVETDEVGFVGSLQCPS